MMTPDAACSTLPRHVSEVLPHYFEFKGMIGALDPIRMIYVSARSDHLQSSCKHALCLCIPLAHLVFQELWWLLLA